MSKHNYEMTLVMCSIEVEDFGAVHDDSSEMRE